MRFADGTRAGGDHADPATLGLGCAASSIGLRCTGRTLAVHTSLYHTVMSPLPAPETTKPTALSHCGPPTPPPEVEHVGREGCGATLSCTSGEAHDSRSDVPRPRHSRLGHRHWASHWSYSVDDGDCYLCKDAEFNTEELALRDGHTAALMQLDRQYAPVQALRRPADKPLERESSRAQFTRGKWT